MTKKQYRSAMGKTVDMGALLLQNESVRAVGNMGVNARGDVIDGSNRVIDKKSRQIQRQNRRSTNVSKTSLASVVNAKNSQPNEEEIKETEDFFEDVNQDELILSEAEPEAEPESEYQGGLASAIARTRTVKQQLEKTPRQLAKEAGVKKI
jgi:hypothetical protein